MFLISLSKKYKMAPWTLTNCMKGPINKNLTHNLSNNSNSNFSKLGSKM